MDVFQGSMFTPPFWHIQELLRAEAHAISIVSEGAERTFDASF